MTYFELLRLFIFGAPTCARDLKRRSRLKIDGRIVTVDSVELCDGEDDRPRHFIILDGKAAVALYVKLFERDPIVLHPGARVSILR